MVANYTVAKDVEAAIKSSGAKQMVFLTDFFGAAKQKVKVEAEQGKMMVDVAKANGIEYLVFLSVADLEPMLAFRLGKRVSAPGVPVGFSRFVLTIHHMQVHHFVAKGEVEQHLKASGLRHSILRPVAFFENYDDPANYNPLKRGSLKFLTLDPCFMVGTYDVGKAAAAMLSDKEKWNGKTLTCTSWKGTLKEAAAALEAVSGTKTVGSLAMPKFARSCFLSDLDAMCVFFEDGYPGTQCSVEAFKAVVPDALDAEGWFRYYGRFADGTPIAKAA